MTTKIKVTGPKAEYKGKIIVKIGEWYKVSNSDKVFKSLSAATDSIQ